ncbi:response regulator transcription factor [Brevibacillus migulae]|uniref:response regulator transcription factor n=1 Tax=Brevibacillus migulae TaxID=1644114 RepID=UPI00106EC58D|nr:response regulator transcription factor [Brevibacillus migulae]
MKKGLYVSEQLSGFARLAQFLQTHSIELVEAERGSEEEGHIHFVLLDCWEKAAFPLVHTYRKRFPQAGILVLATQRDETDLLQAFSQGADDYQFKPCSEREVAARIRAILKRKEAPAPHISPPAPGNDWDHNPLLEWEGVRMQLDLTKTESRLLQYLLAHQKTIASRQQIIQAVWGGQIDLSSKVLDVHLYNLRKKLQQATDGRISIKTVTNKGFYLISNKE